MNNKSQLIKVDSTKRPKFSELPPKGTSGWYGLYVGYDPDIKIIGLNHVQLSIKSTNKLIRYNLQRVLKRDVGTYTVLSGSGELEPFARKRHTWKWGPDNLAGLPITVIQPDQGIDLRAVMIGQLQLEVTHVSTQSTAAPEGETEALEIACKVQTLLSGELDRSEAQGNLYIAPIPPPTDDDGISGDFSPVEHIINQVAGSPLEFPESHFCLGNTPPFFVYENEFGSEEIIQEINKPGLWGEYFKLPHPLYYGTWDEDKNQVDPATVACPYGRVAKTTGNVASIPEGTYVLVPQPMNLRDPKVATSVQTAGYGSLEWNDVPSVSLFPPNSNFAYEGVNPGSSADDTVVDGVSLNSKKGGASQGYRIHKNADRQLKSKQSTRIPMPAPSPETFVGGMPLELCTPHGISNLVLLRNSRELKGFWKDLLTTVIAVARVIVDVGDAVAKVAAKDGPYTRQLEAALDARQPDVAAEQARQRRLVRQG